MNSNSTILIIDDDEISLLILQNAFESEGYNVITTTDSQKAEELFEQHTPHVVVLDIFMPKKDGFEVVKEIRSHSNSCLIVAISSNELYLSAIKSLGADVSFPKSIMPDVLVAAIKAL